MTSEISCSDCGDDYVIREGKHWWCEKCHKELTPTEPLVPARVEGEEPKCEQCKHPASEHATERTAGGCQHVLNPQYLCSCRRSNEQIWRAALRTLEREGDEVLAGLEVMSREIRAELQEKDAELSALRAQVAGLEKDKTRLDWLDSHGRSLTPWFDHDWQAGTTLYPNLRPAIDAAMRATPTENGHER